MEVVGALKYKRAARYRGRPYKRGPKYPASLPEMLGLDVELVKEAAIAVPLNAARVPVGPPP